MKRLDFFSTLKNVSVQGIIDMLPFWIYLIAVRYIFIYLCDEKTSIFSVIVGSENVNKKKWIIAFLFVSNFLKISWVATNLDRKKPSLNFPKLNRFFPVFRNRDFSRFSSRFYSGSFIDNLSLFDHRSLWGENRLLSDFQNAGGFPSKKFERK